MIKLSKERTCKNGIPFEGKGIEDRDESQNISRLGTCERNELPYVTNNYTRCYVAEDSVKRGTNTMAS